MPLMEVNHGFTVPKKKTEETWLSSDYILNVYLEKKNRNQKI